MTVLVRCLRRIPSISRAEFQEHWLHRERRRLASSPTVRRSIQFHTLGDPGVSESSLSQLASDSAEYDGISMEWFDDLAGLEGHLAGRDEITESRSESWFIDHARSMAQVAMPHLIFEPEDVEIVMVQCLKKRPDLDDVSFNRIWLEHAPLGFLMKDLGWLKGYYQVHWANSVPPKLVAPLGSEPPQWDGIVLSYFESTVAIKAMSADPSMEESYKHSVTFLDENGWLAMVTRRHVLKEPVI